MSKKVIRCDRCSRRLRNPRTDSRWNATFDRGNVVGYTCPDCQTIDENTEAEVNEATLEYCGRIPGVGFLARPKV